MNKEGLPEEVACEECREGWVAARVWGEDVDLGRSWPREQYEQRWGGRMDSLCQDLIFGFNLLK